MARARRRPRLGRPSRRKTSLALAIGAAVVVGVIALLGTVLVGRDTAGPTAPELPEVEPTPASGVQAGLDDRAQNKAEPAPPQSAPANRVEVDPPSRTPDPRSSATAEPIPTGNTRATHPQLGRMIEEELDKLLAQKIAWIESQGGRPSAKFLARHRELMRREAEGRVDASLKILAIAKRRGFSQVVEDRAAGRLLPIAGARAPKWLSWEAVEATLNDEHERWTK